MNREDKNLDEEWALLSDDLLRQQLGKIISGTGWSSSTSHWEFIKIVYPAIHDPKLKERVNNILPSMAASPPLDTEIPDDLDLSGRALYVCSSLQIPNARSVLIEVMQKIGNPEHFKKIEYLSWINDSLRQLPIQEAESFLVRQLEALPNDWYEFIWNPQNHRHLDRSRYITFAMAQEALRKINPGTAGRYEHKFKQGERQNKPVAKGKRQD